MEIQKALGADIIMAFDECAHYPADYDYVLDSVRLTSLWAQRCMKGKGSGDQALFGIVQGSMYRDLREKSARDLVAELTDRGGDPEALVRERGLEAVSDTDLLESVADEVIGANPDVAEAYARGDKKVVNFLMGQVMKKTQGKADPGQVREILARKLGD